MSSTMIQPGTDASGNPWGGDPAIGQAQVTPNADLQTQVAQALAYYNSNPGFAAYINNTFGPSYAWMMNIPDLRNILITAAAAGWGEPQIAGALEQTQWWQQNGDSVKQFQQTQATDPGQAAQLVSAQKASIQTQAQQMGVNLTDAQLTDLGTQAAEFQWNSSQITLALQASFTYPTNGNPSGQAAGYQPVINQVAGNYLVQATPDLVSWLTTVSVHNGQSPQDLQNELTNVYQQQAEQRFPWMTAALQQGMTPKDYLQPYTTQAAQTLGISPDQVDWTDPKWQSALLVPGLNGQQTPVNTDQFNKNLMQDPRFGYSKTQNAINQAYTTAKTIEETFGAIKQ